MGTDGSRGPSGQLPLGVQPGLIPGFAPWPCLCSHQVPGLSQWGMSPALGLGSRGNVGGDLCPSRGHPLARSQPGLSFFLCRITPSPRKTSRPLDPKAPPKAPLPAAPPPLSCKPASTGRRPRSPQHQSHVASLSLPHAASRLPSSSPALDAWFRGSNPGPIYTGS